MIKLLLQESLVFNPHKLMITCNLWFWLFIFQKLTNWLFVLDELISVNLLQNTYKIDNVNHFLVILKLSSSYKCSLIWDKHCNRICCLFFKEISGYYVINKDHVIDTKTIFRCTCNSMNARCFYINLHLQYM